MNTPQWQKIVDYRKNHSVTETMIHFNCSLSWIYDCKKRAENGNWKHQYRRRKKKE